MAGFRGDLEGQHGAKRGPVGANLDPRGRQEDPKRAFKRPTWGLKGLLGGLFSQGERKRVICCKPTFSLGKTTIDNGCAIHRRPPVLCDLCVLSEMSQKTAKRAQRRPKMGFVASLEASWGDFWHLGSQLQASHGISLRIPGDVLFGTLWASFFDLWE